MSRRSGPRPATMERLFAEKRAAQPELTDWISCTTPPVRDGDYDYQHKGRMLDGSECPIFRALFDGRNWFSLEGYKLPGLNNDPENFSWRGVRKWVLVRRDDPFLSTLFCNPTDAYVTKRTARSTSFSNLNKAKAFDTKEQAEAYRDRGAFADQRRTGIEAVLS